MIAAMVRETNAMGARLIVLNLPYMLRGRVQPAPAALTAAVAGQDLTFIDFAPAASDYYAHDATGTLTNGLDAHPNPRAHRMIAETVAVSASAFLTPEGSGHARAR